MDTRPSLPDLLAALFSPDELNRAVADMVDAKTFRDLPVPAGKAANAYAFEVAEWLDRRGLVNEAFRDYLLRERPQQADVIRALFAGHEARSVESSAPVAPPQAVEAPRAQPSASVSFAAETPGGNAAAVTDKPKTRMTYYVLGALLVGIAVILVAALAVSNQPLPEGCLEAVSAPNVADVPVGSKGLPVLLGEKKSDEPVRINIVDDGALVGALRAKLQRGVKDWFQIQGTMGRDCEPATSLENLTTPGREPTQPESWHFIALTLEGRRYKLQLGHHPSNEVRVTLERLSSAR